MARLNRLSWLILAAVGLLFVGWGFHQLVNIPRYPADHWHWLTSDPDVVDYLRFWFRIHGIWTTANGLFFTVIAATAFKNREPWSWWALAYLPVHLLLLTTQYTWLFFVTLPIAFLAGVALWDSVREFPSASGKVRGYGWIAFVVIGLAILYFAYDNIVVIPGLDIDDPNRGWVWLTTDPEVIEYIRFYFRVFGLRVLICCVLTLLTAGLGLRVGSRTAWWVLWLVPLLILIHLFFWSWLAPLLIGLAVLAGFGLVFSYPKSKEVTYR